MQHKQYKRKSGRGAHKCGPRMKASKKGSKSKKGMASSKNPCWTGYEAVGVKKKGGRTVPNCVPKKGLKKRGRKLG